MMILRERPDKRFTRLTVVAPKYNGIWCPIEAYAYNCDACGMCGHFDLVPLLAAHGIMNLSINGSVFFEE